MKNRLFQCVVKINVPGGNESNHSVSWFEEGDAVYLVGLEDYYVLRAH